MSAARQQWRAPHVPFLALPSQWPLSPDLDNADPQPITQPCRPVLGTANPRYHDHHAHPSYRSRSRDRRCGFWARSGRQQVRPSRGTAAHLPAIDKMHGFQLDWFRGSLFLGLPPFRTVHGPRTRWCRLATCSPPRVGHLHVSSRGSFAASPRHPAASARDRFSICSLVIARSHDCGPPANPMSNTPVPSRSLETLSGHFLHYAHACRTPTSTTPASPFALSRTTYMTRFSTHSSGLISDCSYSRSSDLAIAARISCLIGSPSSHPWRRAQRVPNRGLWTD